MKYLYFILPSLALVACAGQHIGSVESASTAAAYDGTLPDSDSVREPGRVHTYIVNDYIDPNNPRLRHRGHLVDVVEQDEKWNLAPADTTQTNLGPVTAVNDPNAAPNPYSAEFETELAQQRNQYQQLASLGSKMTGEVSRLQDMAEKCGDVISENAELRNRLGELQQEIDTLKPVAPPVAPDAKKPSWWDSIFNFLWQAPQGTPVVAEKPATLTNFLLHPAITNTPPLVSPVRPPQTNADDEAAVPPPGEMSTNEVIQL